MTFTTKEDLMACCGDSGLNLVGIDDEDESIAFSSASTDMESTVASDDDTAGASLVLGSFDQGMNVPYSRATPLYKNIEKKDWESVLLFLQKGKWSTSYFTSTSEHLHDPTPEVQCQTWVFSEDSTNPWTQLPIHAAISHEAPAVVIQKLLDLHPDAAKCRDSENMLPIHLAFGFGSNDNVIIALLDTWPESITELGGNQDDLRTPVQCCELGPNRTRGQVLESAIEQTKQQAMFESQTSWRQQVVTECQRLRLNKDNLQVTSLQVLLKQLMEDRKQLLEIKQKLKGKFGGPSPKNASDNVSVSSKRSLFSGKSSSAKSSSSIRSGWSRRFSISQHFDV